VFAGANVSQPDNAYPLSRYQTKKILFVGVDWERKGGPQLLEAFKQLLKKHPDARLDIVGCMPSIKLPNVKVWGRIPIEDVKRFYETGAIFCMPSKREPFGIVYLEAMAFKLPIVALNIGALPDFVDEGETGFLLEYDDILGLSSKLIFLIENPAICQQMGEKAYQKFLGQYNWQRSVQSIKDYMYQRGFID
jgi:glycosyltransferase involved in cell wall biosynthesis